MDHRMTQKEIDEALVLAMEADKREIERLRADLAASQKLAEDRLEEQRQMAADLAEIERLRMGKDARLFAELAASQAREKVRIEALKRAAKTFTDYGRHHMKKAPPDLDKASSNVDLATDMMAAFILPFDDTALRAALDQRERETIERCAVEAYNAVSCSTAAQASIKKLCVDAIRALEVKP